MVKQDRFQFLGQYAMRVLNKGAFLASFTVTDAELGIEFRDVCLFHGANGDFVRPPYKEYTDKEGEVKKVDLWRPSYDFESKARDPKGEEYLNVLAKAARAFYDKQPENKQAENKAAAPAKRAPARGGRGPVARKDAPTTATATKDKTLPF